MAESNRQGGSRTATTDTALADFAAALATASPPKQHDTACPSATSRYYAGFSEQFVADLMPLPNEALANVVLDPWMGSGTATRVAHRLGHRAIGVDLNPAMVVIARARLLTKSETESASKALQAVTRSPTPRARVLAEDPLLQWFDTRTTQVLRGLIGRALPKLDITEARLDSQHVVQSLSPIESHVLASIFLVVRRLLASFVGSNPTWVRLSANSGRSRASWPHIRKALQHASDELQAEALESVNGSAEVELQVASSLALPDIAKSATWAISSPPYCTRIDYAVASRPELAVLGMQPSAQDRLRREMLGTTTVPKAVAVSPSHIGNEAARLLHDVSHHQAKASATYYRKWLAQYYDGLATSLDQLSALDQLRVMALVVQDSHYKEIRMDLASIMTEMCTMRGWTLAARRDFPVPRTKATINPGTRKYRDTFDAAESVLVLGRVPSRQDGGTE